MDVGIQSLWIILTVMVPGLVFYGTFWLICSYLNVLPVLLFLNQSETTSLAVLFAIMFTLQLFGIATESIFFKYGPYRHRNAEYQNVFDKRYEIISTMDPEKDYHVERILSQFFMSHNIAVGMTINLFLLATFLFSGTRDTLNQGIANMSNLTNLIGNSLIHERGNLVFIIILIITLLAWFVSYNRFFQSCNVLHAHMQKIENGNNLSLSHSPSETSNSEDDGNIVSSNSIIISCLLIAGSIGHIRGHLGEGILVGLAIGFLIVSYLRDKSGLTNKKVINVKSVKYTSLFCIIIIGIVYALFEDFIGNLLSKLDIMKHGTSAVLLLVGLGMAMSKLISFKNISILEQGYLSRYNRFSKDDVRYEIRFLDKNNLKDMIKLQGIIIDNLPDKELYQPASSDLFEKRLSKKQSVIGVLTDDGLIAFGIFYTPGKSIDNLGKEIHMPDSDLIDVAQLQYIVVHPNYRGNSLQKKLITQLLSLAHNIGCKYALGIISPKNYFSLRNMLCLGFVIRDINKKHGGMDRCVMYKDLVNANPIWREVVNIVHTDIEGQEKLLEKGFVGIDVSTTYAENFVIYYGKR